MEGEEPDLDGVTLACDALNETARVGEATAVLALVDRPGVEGDKADLTVPGDWGGGPPRLKGFEVVDGASPLLPLIRAGVEEPFRRVGVDIVLIEEELLAFDSGPGRGDAEYELSVESLRTRTGTMCSLHCKCATIDLLATVSDVPSAANQLENEEGGGGFSEGDVINFSHLQTCYSREHSSSTR